MAMSDHARPAEPQHEGGARADQEDHQGEVGPPEAQRAQARVHVLTVGSVELRDLIWLAREGAHHLHAGQVLLEDGRHLSELLLDRAPHRPHPVAEVEDIGAQQRHRDEGDQAQTPVEAQQDDDDPGQQDQDVHAVQHGATHEALHRVDVFGHARHELSGLGVGVIGEAEPLDVVVDLVAHIVGDPLAQSFHAVALAEREDHAHERDAHDQERGLEEIARPTGAQADIDHLFDQPGDDQVERGDDQQANVCDDQ